MGQSTIDIGTLIGSRICHDLISPIGAINNGLELLDMSGGAPGPEMDLIASSVSSASARIRFFRIAFGAASDNSMGHDEICSILNDMTQGGRQSVEWGVSDAQPRSEVRMVFLALQCLENAMPYGGRIEIDKTGDTWTLHGMADKLTVNEEIWTILATRDAPSTLQPAQVQFALLPLIARDEGRRVIVDSGPTHIKLSF
ncbi:histidine phosphotransferase family protein [Sulfitobacter sabulilitoris]|uniref:Histidine phosphotransferase n=1 Tax=Sulfitobacter sabulilitoris TaxID=2562655 RepID=A0A5S3PK64_9RHOB|nr:histidine phosphotransferase family protein [Sulfitobacter sabulilitoris]TMM54646.1 histidine phosphotransferase [Sulfitobacter sabulilitoris]